ncbi:hypothetical protein ACS0TY_019507 [Phlomoides rotata]
MPKELPGFYFDAEKNRYFPYKGPIPGSSTKPPSVSKSSDSKAKEADILCQSIKKRQRLLQARELWGNVISSRKGKLSFRTEYQKSHASQPTIWKYKGTKKVANFALGHVVADVSMPHGLVERDILVGVSSNGMLHLFLVGKVEWERDHMDSHKVDCVWPLNLDQQPRRKELIQHLASSCDTRSYLTSEISCIKLLRKSSLQDDAMSKQIMVTTLGSDSASGSVYLLDLSQPLRFDVVFPVERFQELASFKQTLWAVDCDLEGRRAAIGTNRGVILLNMETGASSWVLRCKSDVLSVQLKQPGNSILCGLRNGAIMTVDTRQKHIKSRADRSSTVSMPSSVCCLASLELWDQYFLASSMDGSIRLYDHRQMQKGPVQSYEGNVNSHTRIELGVDPSERVVLSGGEDCYLRLWDIKSGELLFRERFMNSIPSAVCWPRQSSSCIRRDDADYRNYWEEHSLGAWVGSYEGIFYMDWL